MDVFVLVVVVLVVVVACKYVEYTLRKPYIERITERYILITGCDTGFGNLLAKQLDRKGIPVIATCLTERGREEVKKGTSDRLTALLMDVTKHESIVKAFQRVKEILPNDSALWGIVNNAGIGKMRGFLEWSRREDFEKTAAVNLFGTVDVTLTFLPLLKNGGGRIVQMVSVGGRTVLTGIAGGYLESKFGLEAFSDNVRRECIRLGYPIKVSILEPSFFQTPLTNVDTVTATIREGWERLTDQERAQFPSDAPVKRAKMITDSIKLLCSSQTSKVTNTIEHALFSRWPKTRYTVGIDAKLFWVPVSYLPTSISDPIISFV